MTYEELPIHGHIGEEELRNWLMTQFLTPYHVEHVERFKGEDGTLQVLVLYKGGLRV